MNNTLVAQPNQTPVSSLRFQEKKTEQKPHDMKNEHVGWEGRFTAGVFYGYGA